MPSIDWDTCKLDVITIPKPETGHHHLHLQHHLSTICDDQQETTRAATLCCECRKDVIEASGKLSGLRGITKSLIDAEYVACIKVLQGCSSMLTCCLHEVQLVTHSSLHSRF